MAKEYSLADLLDFLDHANDKGLMPANTAIALKIAARTVFSVLDEQELTDIRTVNMEATIRRFTNKRKSDFNPSSLKEYGRRARKAVELYTQWMIDPTEFSVKTRNTSTSKKTRITNSDSVSVSPDSASSSPVSEAPLNYTSGSGYQSSFPIRTGRVVTLSNIPSDLTSAEAERLAAFIKMLAVD